MIGLVSVVAVLGLGFGGGYWYAHAHQGSSTLPNLGKAPTYRLTNQLGKAVTSRSFRGKVRIVTFLFPYCTEYCPLIAAHLVSLERVIKAAGLANQVQIVAFNVDPRHTGPKVLSAFMRQYGWNPHNTHWQFLTGSAQQIRRVVTGSYHIDYQQVPEALSDREAKEAEKQGIYNPPPQVPNPLAAKARPDYDVTHNDAITLVGRRGYIRRYYNPATQVPTRTLMRAVRRLLGEAPNSA
ncbi:MAG: SCO family protein [Gammaproteobacteria bacterium]